MTTHIPPTGHKEIDFLDEVERELVALTTARLEEEQGRIAFGSPTLANVAAPKTVIPANAGTHAECDDPAEGDIAMTQRGDGSRRAPGVS